MVIRSRACRDPNCRKEIIWSNEVNVFVNLDDGQLHRLTCSWTHNNGNNESLGKIVLVSSEDFKEGLLDLQQRLDATQRSTAHNASVLEEIRLKLNAVLRNR